MIRNSPSIAPVACSRARLLTDSESILRREAVDYAFSPACNYSDPAFTCSCVAVRSTFG